MSSDNLIYFVRKEICLFVCLFKLVSESRSVLVFFMSNFSGFSVIYIFLAHVSFPLVLMALFYYLFELCGTVLWGMPFVICNGFYVYHCD